MKQCLLVADQEGNVPLHSCLKLMSQDNLSSELVDFYCKAFQCMLNILARENPTGNASTLFY
jgi:hypothetical protein